MPAQEGQLSLGGVVVATHEGLVVATGQADDLSAGSSLGRAHGRAGERNAIIVVGEHQQGALHARRVAAGSVQADAQRGAGGDLLLPAGVLVVGIERLAAVEGVGRREGRDAPALAGERHQQRGASDEAASGIQERTAGEPKEPERGLMAHRVGRDGRAVDERRLGDRRRQIRVARRYWDDVAA